MVSAASWHLCRLLLLPDVSWPLHSETELGEAEQERDMRVGIEQVSVWLSGIASNSLHGRSLDNWSTFHWCGWFTSTVFCAMFSPRPLTLTGTSMSSCEHLGSEVKGDKKSVFLRFCEPHTRLSKATGARGRESGRCPLNKLHFCLLQDSAMIERSGRLL